MRIEVRCARCTNMFTTSVGYRGFHRVRIHSSLGGTQGSKCHNAICGYEPVARENFSFEKYDSRCASYRFQLLLSGGVAFSQRPISLRKFFVMFMFTPFPCL